MNVNVRGKNIVVTPALKEYVEKKITKITRQFKTVGDISAVLNYRSCQRNFNQSPGIYQRYVFVH